MINEYTQTHNIQSSRQLRKFEAKIYCIESKEINNLKEKKNTQKRPKKITKRKTLEKNCRSTTFRRVESG